MLRRTDIPLLIVALLLLALTCLNQMAEGASWQSREYALTVTVIGRDDAIKPSVRVDLHGPRQMVASTDDTGRLALSLPRGGYTVTVTEGTRSQSFSVNLDQDKQVTLKLSWE